MDIRLTAIAIAALDAAACAGVAVAMFNSESDHATIGFDHAAGVIVTGLFLVTGLPALVLASTRRAPNTALAFALAFPALFVALFVAAAVYFTV
jgi:hypothetical protein